MPSEAEAIATVLQWLLCILPQVITLVQPCSTAAAIENSILRICVLNQLINLSINLSMNPSIESIQYD